MAMGECSAYSSLQADSKVKFAAWPTSWQPPGTDRLSSRWSKMNSHIWLAPYRQHNKYRPEYVLCITVRYTNAWLLLLHIHCWWHGLLVWTSVFGMIYGWQMTTLC